MSTLRNVFEILNDRMFLHSRPPSTQRVIRAWKEFELHLSNCGELTDEEQILFQDRIVDITQTLDLLEQAMFVRVHIPEKCRKHFLGLLTGRLQGLPDKARDSGLVIFYINTSEITLKDLWEEIQWKNFKRDHDHIYHFWAMPKTFIRFSIALTLVFWVFIVSPILIYSPMAILAQWKILLALSACPFIAGLITGYLGRLFAYPFAWIQMAHIEKKAQTNAYYRRALSSLRQPNIPLFYTFIGTFVRGTYESHSEEQVILH
ncbi:MAG: hypothetical protein AAB400_05350 [Patescibacteria group bacterium]